MKRHLRIAWVALGLVASVVVPLRVAEIHQAHEARQGRELAASLPANSR